MGEFLERNLSGQSILAVSEEQDDAAENGWYFWGEDEQTGYQWSAEDEEWYEVNFVKAKGNRKGYKSKATRAREPGNAVKPTAEQQAKAKVRARDVPPANQKARAMDRHCSV